MRRLRCSATAERELGRYRLRREIAHGDLDERTTALAAQETIVESEPLLNVAAYLPRMAARQPDRPAIVWSEGRGATGRLRYRQLTFRQLNEETDRYAHGLTRAGIACGTRTILMVRPSLPFFALTFALYKVGAIPVLIDPGMGKRRMVDCLEQVHAEAFIGIPPAHLLRLLHRRAFRSVRLAVTVGRRWAWRGPRLDDLRTDPWRPFEMAPTQPDDPAAIIFTTGSTGPPKGVLYLHGTFDAQVRILRDDLEIAAGGTDLPTFPLFALFAPALGLTAVLPEMDFTRPADVNPHNVIDPILDHGITQMFGSPALLDRVSRYGEANGIRLPSLRRIISAGAPVPPTVLARLRAILHDDAEIFTPYGATEALPVTSIGSREILSETRFESERGRGMCVGRPVPGVEVRIIQISDQPMPAWSDRLCLPADQIGEIAVKGPVVTREYCTDAAATKLAKIRDGDAVWHRMGDVGRFDDRGRLWFFGRNAHRVLTEDGPMFTVPCEAIFNAHPKVRRSALVGVGLPPRQRPVICIEMEPVHRRANRAQLRQELLNLARGNETTRRIDTILFHPAFPVDIRHNAKIFREKLAVWAAAQLR